MIGRRGGRGRRSAERRASPVRRWLNIILTINMEIALISPPIGLNLFVFASISKQPLGTAVRGVQPLLILMLCLLALVTYVPAVSLWLPQLV